MSANTGNINGVGDPMNDSTDDEIGAVADCYRALEDLDRQAQIRILRYLIARFGLNDNFIGR